MSRNLKTHLNELSPYQETLYLDADILPLMAIPKVWDYLEHGDMAMVLDHNSTLRQCDHISRDEIEYTLKTVSGSTYQFNSGVMLWRKNDEIHSLFKRWQGEWKIFQKHDQLAQVRAIAVEDFAVVHMPVDYNTARPEFMPEHWPSYGDPYLLHCWGDQVLSGKFFNTARILYPGVVAIVEEWLS